VRRKLPRHTHLLTELIEAASATPAAFDIPKLDWTKMAFETWSELITQCGAWTAEQINQVLTSWSQMILDTALGLLDWTKIAGAADDLLAAITSPLTNFVNWVTSVWGGKQNAPDFINAHTITGNELIIAKHIFKDLTITDNSPSAGYVAWSACTVYYNGTNYSIAAGNTNLKYIWFDPAYPTAFQTSDTKTALTADMCLVATNDNGTATETWNKHATIIDGRHIKTGTITADELIKTEALITEYAQIQRLDAGVIDAGYLSVDRIEAGTITSDKLYSGTVMANRISAQHLRTDTAVITDQLQLADLVVTSTKLAELLGIRSAEIPVTDPDTYTVLNTKLKGEGADWTSWTDVSITFKFNAYADIKNELNKVEVDVRLEVPYGTPATKEVQVRCMYSTDGGTTWVQFGTTYSDTTADGYTHVTFTDTVLAAFNTSLWVKLQMRVYNGSSVEENTKVVGHVKNFILSERAFRSDPADVL